MNVTGVMNTSNTIIGKGATLNIGDGGVTGTFSGDNVSNSGTLVFNRSDNSSGAGNISGTGSLIKEGAGTLSWHGHNTGGTTIKAGTLDFQVNDLLGNVVNNATLKLSGNGNWSGVVSGSGNVVIENYFNVLSANTYTGGTRFEGSGQALVIGNGGTTGSIAGNIEVVGESNTYLVYNHSDDVTVSGVVSGGGTLVQAGTGTTTLTGENSYTGDTIVVDGAVRIGNGGTTGSVASTNLILGYEGSTGRLIFDRSNNLSYGGTIQGNGSVTQQGTGILTLGGDNTYGLGTILKAGTVSVSTEANLGNASGGLAFNGGILQVTGTGFGSTARSIDWQSGGGGFDIADAAHSFTVAQTLAGTGGLTKKGAGTVVLNGADTYTGGTNVNAGSLKLGATGSLADTGAVTVAGGAALDLTSHAETVGSLAGGGSVNLGTRTVTTGGNNTSTEFSGVVSGSGGVVKQGTGTFTLSGANDYSGGTLVSGGTVVVANNVALGTGTATVGAGGTLKVDDNTSLGNALLLLDGSTLSGDGTVTSNVTVGEGATISPGNSPGTFHGTDFNWGGGGHYHFEVNDFTGTAGTNWDLLSLTGGLNITATAGSPFVIDLASLDPTNVAGMAAHFSAGQTYNLLLAWADTGITGFDPTLFSVNSTDFLNPVNGGVWSIVNQTNGVYLHFAGSGDVPEPNTLALLGLGALGWLRRRRG